jgi:hypothetical protein
MWTSIEGYIGVYRAREAGREKLEKYLGGETKYLA